MSASEAGDSTIRRLFFRRFGFGYLVVWKESDPFPGPMEHWGWMLNSINASTMFWSQRHGMSHISENGDYWNFLIASIGQAPVFMFTGVIGLFMLMIGPFNFYALKRIKRMSLLLVTVPIGALIFTLGLVFFAVFSDGFSAKARVRSYTRLEAGRAVAMSRHMYFAAFVPSAGLRFPSDTAVYPLHHRPWELATQYGQHYYHSDSEWNKDELVLRSRYLGLREQRQFVVLRSTDCAARLDVKELPATEATAPAKRIRVTNRLGTPLQLAIVRGSNNEIYFVQDLAENTAVELAPLDADAFKQFHPWREIMNADVLDFPNNFSIGQNGMLSNRQQNYSRRYYGNYNSRTSSQHVGLLESGRLLATNVLSEANSNMAPNPQADLLKRQYFVFTATPVSGEDGKSLVPVGLPQAILLQQSHLTHGSW